MSRIYYWSQALSIEVIFFVRRARSFLLSPKVDGALGLLSTIYPLLDSQFWYSADPPTYADYIDAARFRMEPPNLGE